MKTPGIVAAIAVLSGCATVEKTEQIFAISRATYAAEDASAVWSRALQEFQVRNAVIAVANRDSGVLASPVQPSGAIACGGENCEALSSLQFTQYDGVAMLNVWRRVRGMRDWTKPLMTSSDRDALQREANLALSRIVGMSGSPVTTPPAPQFPPRLPPRKKLSGENCIQDTDCASNTCSAGKCAR